MVAGSVDLLQCLAFKISVKTHINLYELWSVCIFKVCGADPTFREMFSSPVKVNKKVDYTKVGKGGGGGSYYGQQCSPPRKKKTFYIYVFFCLLYLLQNLIRNQHK